MKHLKWRIGIISGGDLEAPAASVQPIGQIGEPDDIAFNSGHAAL